MNLRAQWSLARKNLESTDVGFFLLRVTVFLGGLGWLVFSSLPPQEFSAVLNIYIYYFFYNFFIYVLIFLKPQKIRRIYFLGLVFDLLFVFLLVKNTGGFESNFYLGFYLLTALNTFYYGLACGIGLAAVSSLVYLAGGSFDFEAIQWTDYALRVSFLFLIAVPLGFLSEKLRADKTKIESLHCELEKSIFDLSKTQQRLVESEKLSALGRLTADVAHEIRNPLTGVGGFARRLYKIASDGTKEKEYAELIVSEVDKLEKTLKDVLIFSRDARFYLELAHLDDVVDSSLKEFSAIFEEQNIEVKKDYRAAQCKALLDRDQVKQALYNFIINALDAMSGKGTLIVRTYIEFLNDIDYIAVDICDNGKGIPAENIKLIFEPFYSTKAIGVGTGLGLSICKKIMDEHSGMIKVRSKLNEGSTFTLYFPLQREEDRGKIKCWQYRGCGIENDRERTCSAYPNFGRVCWAVAGTFSEGKVQGIYAQKIKDCRQCPFYQEVAVRKSV
ncbi:MAG: sensor histidine kinase [Nitrospirae bacterium]|nr:sensor histidine kinase [Nitrospirota bacterium]